MEWSIDGVPLGVRNRSLRSTFPLGHLLARQRMEAEPWTSETQSELEPRLSIPGGLEERKLRARTVVSKPEEEEC